MGHFNPSGSENSLGSKPCPPQCFDLSLLHMNRYLDLMYMRQNSIVRVVLQQGYMNIEIDTEGSLALTEMRQVSAVKIYKSSRGRRPRPQRTETSGRAELNQIPWPTRAALRPLRIISSALKG